MRPVSRIKARLMRSLKSSELRSLHPEIRKEKTSFRTRFVFDIRDIRRQTLVPGPAIHVARVSPARWPTRQETGESEGAGMQSPARRSSTCRTHTRDFLYANRCMSNQSPRLWRHRKRLTQLIASRQKKACGNHRENQTSPPDTVP